jgi:hypothetical protein
MSNTPSYVPAKTLTTSGELQNWHANEPAVPVSALRELIGEYHSDSIEACLRCKERLAALCDEAEKKI